MSAPRDCFGVAPPKFVCRDRRCPYAASCCQAALGIHHDLGPFIPTMRTGTMLPRKAMHMAAAPNRRRFR